MSTTESSGLRLETASLEGIHWAGIVAAGVTGLVHLVLGVRMLPSGMGVSFVLAGLGFVGAICLVVVGYRRRLVYAVGVPFTLVQILLWYYLNFAVGPKSFPGGVGTLGAVDKVAQVVLLAVIAVLLTSGNGQR